MARCPFARFSPAPKSPLSFNGSPIKIVHHTTEGSTVASAESAFAESGSWPHFTVSASDIIQYVDTSRASFALKNRAGGVETNRDGAIQIETVGFAAKPKDPATLSNVARLCRWIEATHGVPPVWPNGFPKVATPEGKDPGGHNRNPQTWDAVGGHYGHSHVPENSHWDPGYTAAEVAAVMPLVGVHSTARKFVARGKSEVDMQLRSVRIEMPLDDQGRGNVLVPHSIDRIVGYLPHSEVRPNVDGHYDVIPNTVAFTPDDGGTTVVVQGGTPAGAARLWLTIIE